MSISISAAFTSIVTFWQNFAINIDLPDFKLPNWLRKLFDTTLYFFTSIMSLIPEIPDFDIRSILVITSLAVPFLLDILTVWFTNPFLKTIVHLIDLTSAFGITYLCIDLIYNRISVLTIILFILACIWMIIRCYRSISRQKVSLDLDNISLSLNNYFLEGILPNKKIIIDLETTQKVLSGTRSTLQLFPTASHFLVPIIYILISVALIIFTMFVCDVFDIPYKFPPAVRLFLPYFLVPLATILIILAILKSSNCGTIALHKLQLFMKRWGLRILMLLLECLYIPILKSVCENIIPVKFSCPYGTVPYSKTSNNTFSIFEKREFKCITVNTTQTNLPVIEWRTLYDNSLLFVNDILIVCGGVIIFDIVFIMIGIPYLWIKLIKMNRSFVLTINSWGKTKEEKWDTLSSRLQTTGIFLFQKYKIQFPIWSVILLITKVLLIIINTFTVKFSYKVSIALPIYYFCLFFITLLFSPYLYTANNILDDVLYIVNLINSLFPICVSFGLNISESIVGYTSLALFILPIISFIIIIFFGNKPKNNPTLMTDEMTDFFEEYKKSMEESYKRKHNRDIKISDKKVLEKMFRDMDNEEIGCFEEESKDEESLDDLNNNSSDDEFNYKKVVVIQKGQLDSINEVIKGKEPTKAVKVFNLSLARNVTELYKIVDSFIDAETIYNCAKYLNTSVIFASAAFGWYIKALIETSKTA